MTRIYDRIWDDPRTRVPDRAVDCITLVEEALDEPGGNEPSSSGDANCPALPRERRRHGRRRLCCWHPSYPRRPLDLDLFKE